MPVIIKEVKTAKDINNFISLPFELYKNNPYWVPPIIRSEINSMLPDKNPAMEQCKCKFWLAYKDDKLVGRIGGIINHDYNNIKGENKARFSRMEFIDDAEVSKKLFEIAENWARENKTEEIHGPLGFTNLDLQGLLIEGFDFLPSIGSVYHLPYYKEHIENLGFQKENDWIEFRLSVEKEIPEKALNVAAIIKKKYGLKVINFNSKKEIKPYAPFIFDLLNQSFEGLPYVFPFNQKMIEFYSKKYFNLLNPKFVKVIVDEQQKMTGFIIAIPSLSKAMQKTKGKLFPFGFIHILKALKKPIEVDLLLGGVDPHFHGMGLPSLIMTELQQTIMNHGVHFVETTGIFETNIKAIQNWKNYEHIQHKRRRCYVKKL